MTHDAAGTEIRLEHRVPSPEEHRRIAESVGWARGSDWPSVPRSLERSLFGVVAMTGDRAVGMGLLVGDGVLYFYIQDLAVNPAWRGRGVGQMIVETLLAYIREVTPAAAFVGLFATPDALQLYQRNGFSDGDMTGMFRLVRPDTA
ncbi:MAG TPA: GNAT family N-acetyltransferase [Thermomicrobiales bacterium]|nr:GNAT family N-acetyltransferase [Thermomicrobiales bacterium]